MPRTKQSPRRTILFAALCVVLGLMTSVGVAWGGMFFPLPANLLPNFGEIGPLSLSTTNETVSLLYEETSHRVVSRFDYVAVSEYAGWFQDDRVRDLRTHARLTDNSPFVQAVRRHETLMTSPYRYRVKFSLVYAGWPIHCLAYEDACTPAESWGAGGKAVLFYNMKTGEMTPAPVESDPLGNLNPAYHAIAIGDTLLPTFPLWPGLIANTAIYASAWALLIGGPILLRRWLRTRKGGCAQCGYSREGLKVDAPCPECGHAPALAPS